MSEERRYYGGTASFSNPRCIEYDGVNERTAHGGNFIPATEFSISFWIKLLAFPAFQARYFSDTGGFYYVECSSAGTGNYSFNQNGSTAVNNNTTPLILNTWHHVVLTRKNGVTTKIYQDAVFIAASGGTGLSIPNVTNAFQFGGIAAAGFSVNMRIHLWQVWNVALTAAEVTELYVPNKNPATHSQAANLRHTYRPGNGIDVFPTIFDGTGVANGTMTNMEAGDFVSDSP